MPPPRSTDVTTSGHFARPRAPAGAPNVAAGGTAPSAGRWALAVLAFAIYVGCIVGANWMISHVGHNVPKAHEHTLPVGFGLQAPSGVYLAGLTFVARDILQRLAGIRAGVAAIIVGAVLSWRVSSAALALASGATFLLSESCDFAVYTPLQARNFPLAVLGSGLVSDAIDSTVFLALAGIPLSVALPGQLVGKAWLVLAGGAVAALLRRWGPFRNPVGAPSRAPGRP